MKLDNNEIFFNVQKKYIQKKKRDINVEDNFMYSKNKRNTKNYCKVVCSVIFPNSLLGLYPLPGVVIEVFA